MRISTSVSMMFRELPLADRFQAAADAGFDGVEIQFIDEGAPQAMARAARAAGMPVVLINLPLGDLMAGGIGLSGVPGREAAFKAAAEAGLAAAGELGAEIVHLGPSRMPTDVNRAACMDVYLRNAAEALTIAERMGLDAMLVAEPMNRIEVPDALLVDVADAAEAVDRIAHERFGLLFDIYQIAMNGVDVERAWREHGGRARHVQFSDAPGRHEPGTGSIAIDSILDAIKASGYRGCYGAEYRPVASTVEGLGWLTALRQRTVSEPAEAAS